MENIRVTVPSQPVSTGDAAERVLAFVESRTAEERIQPPFAQLDLVAHALREQAKREKKDGKREKKEKKPKKKRQKTDNED